MQLSSEYKPGRCWAMVKSASKIADHSICGIGANFCELDSKTANIGTGYKIKVWLCPKHQSNAKRYYQVTIVSAQ